jgi:predicted nucleic-acid-binding protein
MIAIDTNVVVRLLVGDDPAQAARSRRLVEDNELFIADTVILESYWVMRHRYQLDDTLIRAALRGLMGLPSVHTRDSAAIALALEWHERGLEFADAFHLALSAGATGFVTFDRRFTKRAGQVSGRAVSLLTTPPELEQ